MNEEFQKVGSEKAIPVRTLLSNKKAQNIEQEQPIEIDNRDSAFNECDIEKTVEEDHESSLAPRNILDNLPKNFYDDLLSSKWKERKEALDSLHQLASFPKLEDGRYGELLTALSKKIADANVIVATVAIQCIDLIAKGLKTQFSIYQTIVIESLLERCKDKKVLVLEATRSALDSVFQSSFLLSDVTEQCMATLIHKNPQVKSEGIRFLMRCFQKSKKVPVKVELKLLAEGLLKVLDDADLNVREASYECFGTLMKLCGEKAMFAYIDKVDAAKLPKIKEFFASTNVKLAGGVRNVF